MICNSKSPNAPKLKFTADKRIPAVHAAWLWDSLQTGKLQPYSDYQLTTLSTIHPQRPKPNPSPSIDVPTAKLSEEDSFKLRQRKAPSTKVVANLQQLQQPRVLDLAPSAETTPACTTGSFALSNTSADNPGLDQDKSAIGGLDGQDSFPPKGTAANSPRYSSTSSAVSNLRSRHRSSSAESLIKAIPGLHETKLGKKLTPDSDIPVDTEAFKLVHQNLPKAPEEEKDYSVILAQLRANRRAAPMPAVIGDIKPRRRRQLGRATSTRSNQSTGESSGNLGLDEDDDSHPVLIDEYQPSQELGWDSPGAAKAREQMIKKLGGTIQERSVPVKGIGMVKDAVNGSTGRAGRKRRG